MKRKRRRIIRIKMRGVKMWVELKVYSNKNKNKTKHKPQSFQKSQVQGSHEYASTDPLICDQSLI